MAIFFGSEEFLSALAPARVEVLWIRGEEELSLGQVEVDNVIAHVHWNGRLAGVLSGFVIDQPYYHGVWVSAGDPAFEQEYRMVQARDGRGALKVTFQDAEGKPTEFANAMIRPAPETAPYFRFRSPDVPDR